MIYEFRTYTLHPRNLPEFKCGRCGQPMIFDDMPDRYLSFLDDTGEEAASVS